MIRTNPELLNRTRYIVTFNGRKVKCFPSTFMMNAIHTIFPDEYDGPVPTCTGEIMEGESKGKWTTVTGEAALVGCDKKTK